MRVPRELLDKIIGEFDLSEKYDIEIAHTLESCALIARSFVGQCQARLFARISVRDYKRFSSSCHIASTILAQKLFALLSRSPHLAGYIRTLNLCYNAMEREANFIPHILSAVTGLTELTLWDHGRGFFPMNALTLAAFSLSSLWRVELFGYQFQNAFELESLLSKAKCLKELALKDVGFKDFTPLDDSEVTLPRQIRGTSDVKLETLCLEGLDRPVVTSVLDSFTTIDIRHLKSLSIYNSVITGILRANARSIQQLKLEKSFCQFFDVPDPQIMAGENSLTSVNFEVDDIQSLLVLVPLLGDLGNLTALKTVGLKFQQRLGDFTFEDRGEWEELDGLLEPLATGIQVDVYATFDPDITLLAAHDVAETKMHLPKLSNREKFHVYHNSQYS
ncbi:hypothetical protein C8R45DRAFT_1013866 [Mycena sanguinolenta]|nr:hypothetical protein C8R45DRAFT_1013866 [Mycena sanguinolenta]